jgi:hypothetical protein
MTKTENNRMLAWRLKLLREASLEPRSVAQTCRHFGLSRQAFYKWKAGYELHGEAGLCDRPRVPLRSPNATPREVEASAVRFVDEVLRRLPFRVLVIQTDNGAEFQSRFHWHLESLDIRHVYIRPRTPHLNGKVERSHRVDDQEFYQLLDKDGISDNIHLFNDKLREWEDYYNYHRPHGALDGQTPYERLMAKSTASLSPKP